MPFVKVDEAKRIKEQCEKDPEYAKLIEKAMKEFDDIEAGKIDKKFGE